jgi:alcohol dehydrogenase class IV
MKSFAFNTVGQIVFGEGASSKIGEIAKARLGQRIFLVTDPGLLASGIIEPALQSLRDAGIDVRLYSEVVADPPEAVIEAAAAQATEFGSDAVIGFGGGSSMDVAKLVALLAAGRERLSEVYGVGNAKGPRLPLLLVPTTAGTGSEVTPISIVTTGESEKKGVVTPVILPDIALLDPELTYALPRATTAMTGIDAMVHAIEAHASASANNNPLSRSLAREALRLLGASLERAVRDGGDRVARADMLLGAMLAGQSFANSPVAAVHALAYPIGGRYHVPHGLSNSLVLPHVLRFNAATAPLAYADTSVCAFPELANLPEQDRAMAFADKLAELARRCELPVRLRDVNIEREAIDQLATDAMQQTRLLVNNPRSVGEADARDIYTAAW